MSRAEAYAAYRDTDGAPLMSTSCVLFFDLLGVKAMSTAPDAPELLRRLRPALEQAIDRADTEDERGWQASTWFTDNAVVGRPLIHDDLRETVIGAVEITAAYLMLVCWGHGFLGRGAITFGDHYMDENFVFGPALIEAAELEKAARWPRIILGASAVEAERQHSRYYADALQSAQSRCLTCDEEDTTFVDHLGIYIAEESDPDTLNYYLALHKQVTEQALASNPAGSEVWLKWRWTADYQNHALASRLADPERYLVEVPELRYQFVDFLDAAPYTPPGSPWYTMDRQSRSPMSELRLVHSHIPSTPGVYAIYRGAKRMYVGETSSLHGRIWEGHMSKSKGMRSSALRRNVAEHLGFGSAAAIYAGSLIPTEAQRDAVTSWIEDCEIAWQECESKKDARALERQLRENTSHH